MLGIPIQENEVVKESNADFGSHDIFQLTTKNLLEAYTCTECGRCTSVCPAHITGKKLSPRKIMMDVRDRMEEVGRNLDNKSYSSQEGEIDNSIGYNDGRDLFSYIEKEEIRACTSCNACVKACLV